MGTNFLAAGFLQEQLEEIQENTQYLKQLLVMSDQEREVLVDRYSAQGYYTTYLREVEKALDAVVSRTEELNGFLSKLQCQPLIYTGEGETEQVIDMLERLLVLYQAGTSAPDRRRAVGS